MRARDQALGQLEAPFIYSDFVFTVTNVIYLITCSAFCSQTTRNNTLPLRKSN